VKSEKEFEEHDRLVAELNRKVESLSRSLMVTQKARDVAVADARKLRHHIASLRATALDKSSQQIELSEVRANSSRGGSQRHAVDSSDKDSDSSGARSRRSNAAEELTRELRKWVVREIDHVEASRVERSVSPGPTASPQDKWQAQVSAIESTKRASRANN
jgi:hypothetical protein